VFEAERAGGGAHEGGPAGAHPPSGSAAAASPERPGAGGGAAAARGEQPPRRRAAGSAGAPRGLGAACLVTACVLLAQPPRGDPRAARAGVNAPPAPPRASSVGPSVDEDASPAHVQLWVAGDWVAGERGVRRDLFTLLSDQAWSGLQ